MKKQDALNYFMGVKKALAEAAKRSPGAVSQWGDVVPFNAAYNLQEATKGRKGALKINHEDYIN